MLPPLTPAVDRAVEAARRQARARRAVEVLPIHLLMALLEEEEGRAFALAESAGPDGMVGGQMADLQAEGRTDGTPEALEAIHRRKTGALLRASLRMGAIVAGVIGSILTAVLSIYDLAI